MEYSHNPQLQLAFDFVQYTNTNIFLTGKAGTGKTTFLKRLKELSPKRMVVVAPTGVAAINAGGVTIHSFFQLPFSPFIPEQSNQQPVHRFSGEKIKIIKSLDLLVIDEISMVRADVLDAIDNVLRRFRDRNRAFGGVQLLMIGDLQQLAPVIKDEEWQFLRQYYHSAFFFDSRALNSTQHIGIELKHIYRQSDQVFIDLLNQVRENQLIGESLQQLNARFIPDFKPKENEGYITLTTHNAQAKAINDSKMQILKSKEQCFVAKIEGDFPEYLYPNDRELTLKIGAQVMFLKNDSSREKLYYNGKIGKITDLDEDFITVQCADDPQPIVVDRSEWHNTKYSIDDDTKEIKETIIGSYTQYPLKLAWAITIHKSQGLTFEKAIIDANASFAHGQVYVALSRCKSLEGLVLSSRLTLSSIKNDNSVFEFTKTIENNPPSKKLLNDSKRAFYKQLVLELFDFKTIKFRLLANLKQLKEHETSILGSFPADLQNMYNEFSEIETVADKFYHQLNSFFNQSDDYETNRALQERIQKGSSYFLEKLDDKLLKVISATTIESDNKAAKKAVLEAVEKCKEELLIKKACLTACLESFSVKTYLETKAKASIEEPAKPLLSEKKTSTQAVDFSKANSLFHTLRLWRNAKADELNVPEYIVMHQKTLLLISEKKPATEQQLASIKGVGKIRASQYASEMLEIIKTYCEDNNIAQTIEDELPEKETKPKKEKGSSQRLTLEMFKLGKSAEEIAQERAMALSTIEGHLARFVTSGDIQITEIIQHDKLALISDCFLHKNPQSMSEAKSILGDSVSWNELRMVDSFLKSKT